MTSFKRIIGQKAIHRHNVMFRVRDIHLELLQVLHLGAAVEKVHRDLDMDLITMTYHRLRSGIAVKNLGKNTKRKISTTRIKI
jgi:hypothetical protein